MGDSFATASSLEVNGRTFRYFSLPELAREHDISRLPYSLKILLENLLRHEDGVNVTRSDIEALCNWDPKASPDTEIAFTPSRVVLQDFTGVPAVVDLAAMRDAMTGLYNRRVALPRLADMLSEAAAERRPTAVMVVDLDRFKSVNDRHGHAAGDQVLREVAELRDRWAEHMEKFEVKAAMECAFAAGQAERPQAANAAPVARSAQQGFAAPEGSVTAEADAVPREHQPLPGARTLGRDGTGVRDYIHVTDLAKGHIRALAKLADEPGCITHNLGTGTGYSVLEMVAAFEKACGKTIPYAVVPRRPGDIAECYADPARARQDLDWSAQQGLEAMCADAWRWQQQNPSGYP